MDYKRIAKYIFLLPTNVKGEVKKEEVYAIKIDFFGVKGRIEDEKGNESNIFKNEGSSGCIVELFKNGSPLDSNTVIPKQWGHINSFHLYSSSKNFLQQAPLSTTTVFFFKVRSCTSPTSLKVNSKYAKNIRLKLNK